ncbi:glucose transporter type 1 isoform X2 [Frankliniella occidentalis]|uniref:Glucose transporter type 1 isoform X2 n=1 Tax=Frankliniella occidentalis TaxID=133901 RepID=A0A9C6XTD0_FRAOC|nr:glucose transporter type 1 isoform X2 [Frankliniella occidentalis]
MGETRPSTGVVAHHKKPMRKLDYRGSGQSHRHHPQPRHDDDDDEREVVLELQEYDHHDQLSRWEDRDVPGPPRPPRPRGGVLQLRVRNRHSRSNVSLADRLELQGEDEATLRELLVSLQKQVSVMSSNLSAKLDELQRGDRHLETTVALHEIRTQLQELTRSVESCQSEVCEVKRDMVAIRSELDTVQQVKEEIEELREYVDRLEEHTHRRKLRLLQQNSLLRDDAESQPSAELSGAGLKPTAQVRQGLTFFLCYAIGAAVLGMLQFGYNTGVINAPEQNIENFMKDVYKNRYNEDLSEETVKLLYSVGVSIFAIGGMLGGFSGGLIANRFGRKGGLLLNNVMGVGGACLMGFAKIANSYELLFLGRFIIGVNCGLNTSLVPMYITEIAPLNLRGGLGTLNQLAVTIGLLLSQVLGIEQILGTDDGWPLLLGLAVCPAVLQLVLLPMCPESPRYLLMTKHWEEEARKALQRLRASSQVEEDIEEMRAEERAQSAEASISMTELICSPTLRQPLFIGILMQLSQQLSGINAVFYYSTELFISSGLTGESAKFATIGIGVIMFFMTLVSIPMMDKTGRRTLHLYGLGGMFIFSIFITISFLIKMIDWMSYLSVVSTLGFVVFFAVGPGSIPWMITAELFSQGPRPAAMSIAVLVNWMANFLVGIVFPTMKTHLENYTFLPFSVLLAIFWIFTYRQVPETKNKTFEEISAIFRHGGDRRSMRNSSLYGLAGASESLPESPVGPRRVSTASDCAAEVPATYGTTTTTVTESDEADGVGAMGAMGVPELTPSTPPPSPSQSPSASPMTSAPPSPAPSGEPMSPPYLPGSCTWRPPSSCAGDRCVSPPRFAV